MNDNRNSILLLIITMLILTLLVVVIVLETGDDDDGDGRAILEVAGTIAVEGSVQLTGGGGPGPSVVTPQPNRHGPPVFRRVRLFNASDQKVKEIKIEDLDEEADTPPVIKELDANPAKAAPVNAHFWGHADATNAGFEILSGGTGTEQNVNKLRITITMEGSGGDVMLTPIVVDSPGEKLQGLLIAVETSNEQDRWWVTVVAFRGGANSNNVLTPFPKPRQKLP